MFDGIQRRIDELTERAYERPFVRHVGAVFAALCAGGYPVYVIWAFAIRRDFSVNTVVFVIVLSITFIQLMIALVGVLLVIGRRPRWALVALVPVVGFIFVLLWTLEAGRHWKPAAERRAERDAALEGLPDFDKQVFGLRFDTEEDKLYSRRRTARHLRVSKRKVLAAERRLDRHFSGPSKA